MTMKLEEAVEQLKTIYFKHLEAQCSGDRYEMSRISGVSLATIYREIKSCGLGKKNPYKIYDIEETDTTELIKLIFEVTPNERLSKISDRIPVKAEPIPEPVPVPVFELAPEIVPERPVIDVSRESLNENDTYYHKEKLTYAICEELNYKTEAIKYVTSNGSRVCKIRDFLSEYGKRNKLC